MIVVLAAMAIVGWLAGAHPESRWLLIALGVTIVSLAIARGYYWGYFPRGAGWGWLSYNRASALVAFIGVAIGTGWLRDYQRAHNGQ